MAVKAPAVKLSPIVKTTKTKKSFVEAVLNDYTICCISREASLLGRKEVLTGKAKFGILGDGKELAQVAMARAFDKGDFRSGYYRDQTFMMALGLCSVADYFGQLYADPSEPFSGGRQMNAHFATPLVDTKGEWLNHAATYNVTSDISPTGGQMARALGIAQASSFYRKRKIKGSKNFSTNGNEVSFCTIGDASTSEGVFWETMNAASVLQVPLAVAVWDDGYGISVPIKFQTVKKSISQALDGFQRTETEVGLDIYKVKGWDYPTLIQAFEHAIKQCRDSHAPCLIHVTEVTQQLGHSTSGSHERYKDKDRLQWEKDYDCIAKMRQWMIDMKFSTASELDDIRAAAKKYVRAEQQKAYAAYQTRINHKRKELSDLFDHLLRANPHNEKIKSLKNDVANAIEPGIEELVAKARQTAFLLRADERGEVSKLTAWIKKQFEEAHESYQKHLVSETPQGALNVKGNPAKYKDDSKLVNGSEVLNALFDHHLSKNPFVVAFGEDVGKIGDVNQGFAGMQDRHGELRVFDTGIREWTIVGQGLGLSMRGFRPIAEIQYLDYVPYALSILTDDLATVRYRSNNIQQAPCIIRTRGHRLEGVWHSGSPMGMLIHALRGMHFCVPRNMTQAAGMYNTLLQSNDPAMVVECLNGYRLKERIPSNLKKFTVPLGVPEILTTGDDITVVSYGSTLRVVQKALPTLTESGIAVELIDAQTLLPFDRTGVIAKSVQKTNRVLFVDEDVPGGATAYMMQAVLDRDGAYEYLDSKPICLSAQPHRSPFGSEGDYFTKPQIEDVVETVYGILNESWPTKYRKT